MAVSAYWFHNAIANAFGGTASGTTPNIDFLSDTINVALFTNSHAPDKAVDIFYDGAHGMSEVSASGTGYATGGSALSSKTLTYSGGTVVFDAADLTWPSSTITARYACIYDATPGSNKPFLGYVDFGADVSTTNGTFQITWATAGILTVTPA